MSQKYQHIFFDLDHTLWDYETNAKITLIELFEHFELDSYGVSSGDSFYQHFTQINDELWKLFNVGKISKFELRDRRFRMVLESCGAIMKLVSDELIKSLGRAFILECSKKSAVFSGAHKILDYLHPRYPLHIITNGFSETQGVKLQSAGLAHYFGKVITSESAGSKKPFAGIFTYAMKHTLAVPETSIMIGDNLHTDIKGARDFGIDQVYFNPDKLTHEENITYEINSLNELKGIL